MKQRSSVTVRYSLLNTPAKFGGDRVSWFSTCRHVVLRVQPVVDALATSFSSRLMLIIRTHQVDIRHKMSIRHHCPAILVRIFEIQRLLETHWCQRQLAPENTLISRISSTSAYS